MHIIASDSHIRKYASKLIDELIPQIKSLLQGQSTRLSSQFVKKIEAFTSDFYHLSSPELKTVIKTLIDDMENEGIHKKLTIGRDK